MLIGCAKPNIKTATVYEYKHEGILLYDTYSRYLAVDNGDTLMVTSDFDDVCEYLFTCGYERVIVELNID